MHCKMVLIAMELMNWIKQPLLDWQKPNATLLVQTLDILDAVDQIAEVCIKLTAC
jgi:hypothetical protein